MLDLSWNGFEDDGARALCDALKGNNTLTELNIRNNRISTVGAAHIARGLEGNNTLEILKVSNAHVVLKVGFFKRIQISGFTKDHNFAR